jgi:hypothetical protein
MSRTRLTKWCKVPTASWNASSVRIQSARHCPNSHGKQPARQDKCNVQEKCLHSSFFPRATLMAKRDRRAQRIDRTIVTWPQMEAVADAILLLNVTSDSE